MAIHFVVDTSLLALYAMIFVAICILLCKTASGLFTMFIYFMILNIVINLKSFFWSCQVTASALLLHTCQIR